MFGLPGAHPRRPVGQHGVAQDSDTVAERGGDLGSFVEHDDLAMHGRGPPGREHRPPRQPFVRHAAPRIDLPHEDRQEPHTTTAGAARYRRRVPISSGAHTQSSESSCAHSADATPAGPRCPGPLCSAVTPPSTFDRTTSARGPTAARPQPRCRLYDRAPRNRAAHRDRTPARTRPPPLRATRAASPAAPV